VTWADLHPFVFGRARYRAISAAFLHVAEQYNERREIRGRPHLAHSATRPWRVRASKIMAPMLPINDGDAQAGSSTPLVPTRRVRRTRVQQLP